MKRKELIWMLVPCLIFAGVAAYFTWRDKESSLPSIRTTGPSSWRLVKTEHPPLTAQEVGAGYGDKLALYLVNEGAVPPYKAGWDYRGPQTQILALGLVTQKNGKEQPIKLKPSQRWDYYSRNSYSGEDKDVDAARRQTLTIKAPRLETEKPLWLKLKMDVNHYFKWELPKDVFHFETIQSQPQIFKLAVSGRNSTCNSRVSRYCPIQILKTSVQRVGPRAASHNDIRVKIDARCLDAEWVKSATTASWQFLKPNLVDDGGQKYDFWYGIGGGLTMFNPQDLTQVGGSWDFNLTPSSNLNEHSVDNRHGRLWLIGQVSFNNCWPKTYRVLVCAAPHSKKTK